MSNLRVNSDYLIVMVSNFEMPEVYKYVMFTKK